MFPDLSIFTPQALSDDAAKTELSLLSPAPEEPPKPLQMGLLSPSSNLNLRQSQNQLSCDDMLSLTPSHSVSTLVAVSESVAASKSKTAKRRAFRKAAMKRGRSCRDAKLAPTSPVKKDIHVCTIETVDKKVARAIRNREAAMKSRVEAKHKMRMLQDENSLLNVKVKSLVDENRQLTDQLQTLMRQTLTSPISPQHVSAPLPL